MTKKKFISKRGKISLMVKQRLVATIFGVQVSDFTLYLSKKK